MFGKVGSSKISALLVFAMLFSMLVPGMALGATAVQLEDIADSYAQKEIQSLVDSGIISGYEDGTFQPRKVMTRAELAKIIVLSLGLKENPEKAAAFTDVSKSSWYRGYVGALVESGITQGNSDTTFAPDANVTREELVVFFVRAMKLEETAKKLTADAKLGDLSSVSSWAQAHVSLAYKIGFINGVDDKGGVVTFAPKNNAERQALARLAYEFKTNKDKYVAKANELAASKSEVSLISSISAINSTTVEVTFSKDVEAVDKADFTFDNDLKVTAAELKKDSKTIVVLTTSTQTAGTVYKLSYKGQDTGKTVTGYTPVYGGSGSSGSRSRSSSGATVPELLNRGGTYSYLTLVQSGEFGPADGQTTTITGTLTVDPGEDGKVTLRNIDAETIEVLSGDSNSIKLQNSKVKHLLVKSKNVSKNTRIQTLGNTVVVTTSVYSNAILEATSGTLGNITIGSEAAGKTVDLKGNIGNVTVNAAGANIQVLPPTTEGAVTTVGSLNVGANAKVTTDANATLQSVAITAPSTSIEFAGAGAVKTVTVVKAADGSILVIGSDSNIVGIQVNANIKLSGDPAKIAAIKIEVGEGGKVEASDELKNTLVKLIVEKINAIGVFTDYSIDVENQINEIQVAVKNAVALGVSTEGIANYAIFENASKLIKELKEKLIALLNSERDALQIEFNGNTPDAVISDVTLKNVGMSNTKIAWTSSDLAFIAIEQLDASYSKGKVTRPAVGQPDAKVDLTATVSKNGLSSQPKVFNLTVKALTDGPAPSVSANVYAVYSTKTVVVTDGKATVTGTVYGPFEKVYDQYVIPNTAATDYIIVKFTDEIGKDKFEGSLLANNIKVGGVSVNASVYDNVYLVIPTNNLQAETSLYQVTGLGRSVTSQVYDFELKLKKE